MFSQHITPRTDSPFERLQIRCGRRPRRPATKLVSSALRTSHIIQQAYQGAFGPKQKGKAMIQSDPAAIAQNSKRNANCISRPSPALGIGPQLPALISRPGGSSGGVLVKL